jgi:hypothetical protein
MNAALFRAAAAAVLYTHFALVLFNVFWLIAVPLGAWRGWRFVRSFGWRTAHLVSLAVVALQVLLGRFCFLTIWQNDLISAAGGPPATPSLIERLVTRAIFWPLPMWAFIVLYVGALVYTLALWRLVPPKFLPPVCGRAIAYE